MNSNKLVKQEKDSFLVYCDFSHVLAAEETITAYECSVEDSAGVDATVEILEPGSEIIGSGDDKAFLYVPVWHRIATLADPIAGAIGYRSQRPL